MSQLDLRWAFGKPTGSGPVHIPCPFHGDADPSFAVYHDHAHCFGCGLHLTYQEAITKLNISETTLPTITEAQLARLTSSSMTAPPTPMLLDLWQQTLWHPASPRKHRLQWLRDRGLDIATIKAAKLGHTGSRFVIPVLAPVGEAVLGVKYRRDDMYADPEAPKYLSPRGQPPLVYRPAPGNRGPTVIVEGEYDALLLAQYGYDALTTTAGSDSFAKLLKGWRWRKPVNIWTDNDEAGDKAASDIMAVVQSPKFHRVAASAKDATEVLRGMDDLGVQRRLRSLLIA